MFHRKAAKSAEDRVRAQLAQARGESARVRDAGQLDTLNVLASEPVFDALAKRAVDRSAETQTLAFQAGQYREAWSERERDVRALEKLEERDRARHRDELEALERAEMDETARMRHSASRKELPSPSSTGLGLPMEKTETSPSPGDASSPHVPN